MAEEKEMDLDQMMAAERTITEEPAGEVLKGHPALSLDSGESEDSTTTSEEQSRQGSAAVGGQADDFVPGAAAEAGLQGGAAGLASPGSTPAAPERKFKSWDEAERAAREAHGTLTRVTKELAELRRQNEQARVVQDQAAAAAQFRKELKDFSARRHAAALTAINELNPDAADYHQQVAEVWADKDAEIYDWTERHRPGAPGPRTADAGPEHSSTPAREPAGGDDQPAALDPWVYAKARASEAGIDPDDPFFISRCGTVPDKDDRGQSRSLEEMVLQVIDETKAYQARVEARIQTALKEKAGTLTRQRQEAGLPLGASPADPSESRRAAKEEPMGIDGALDQVFTERRI